jgi:hypothetical protein
VREHEVERAAGHAAGSAGAQLLERLSELQLREGVRAPEVVFRQVVEREAVGEEPACERRPDDDAESPLERVRKQILFVCARERRVLELQRRNGPDGECPLDQLRRVVREPAVANLPLLDEPLELAPRLLDRDVPVGVVELEQVDPLALQPS